MALGMLSVIGTSVQERPLSAYQFKNGPNQVVVVGGIHGGYEWNSTALAEQLIDYFTDNPSAIPDSVTLHIIPSANPDGLALINEMVVTREANNIAEIALEETLVGRVNANEVDLNRNWDCKWRASAYWRDQWVSGGSQPFSEPETQALRDYLLEISPQVVVFLHSAADGVFGSGCGETYTPSLKAADIYGLAAGYPVHEKFDAYPVTGDAGDWLATAGIPAFTVELKNHTDLDLSQNIAGMRALLEANR
jgi:predicted deacylase